MNYPFPWRFESCAYSNFYLSSCVSEKQVQNDIVSLLKRYRVDIAAIDAGGRRARGVMMARAKASGTQIDKLANMKVGSAIPAGYADLEGTLAPSGRSLFIEVKAPAWIDSLGKITRAAGVPSREQLEFLFEKHKRGALVMVAWSVGDVLSSLTKLLIENRRAVDGE
jgi:hypothetical protein